MDAFFGLPSVVPGATLAVRRDTPGAVAASSGPAATEPDMAPHPTRFTLHVPDSALADLRDRLARTRLPDQRRSRPGPTAPMFPICAICSPTGRTASTGARMKPR